MNEHVTITGLTRVTKPRPNKGGSIILAYFDCAFCGIDLRGCALVRTRNNGLVAWPPNITDNDGKRSVRISDDSLRHAMMWQARAAYKALGGTDAEWIGKTIPIGPLAAKFSFPEN